MLSEEAIKWLESVDYKSKTHEERMKLIEAAKIAYPYVANPEDEKKLFMQILGLA